MNSDRITRYEISSLRAALNEGRLANAAETIGFMLEELEAFHCDLLAARRRNWWCDRCDTGDFEERCECVKANNYGKKPAQKSERLGPPGDDDLPF